MARLRLKIELILKIINYLLWPDPLFAFSMVVFCRSLKEQLGVKTKISKFIKRLEDVKNRFGDLECYAADEILTFRKVSFPKITHFNIIS